MKSVTRKHNTCFFIDSISLSQSKRRKDDDEDDNDNVDNDDDDDETPYDNNDRLNERDDRKMTIL